MPGNVGPVPRRDPPTLQQLRRRRSTGSFFPWLTTQAGITTEDIDIAVHQWTVEAGAYPSPLQYGVRSALLTSGPVRRQFVPPLHRPPHRRTPLARLAYAFVSSVLYAHPFPACPLSPSPSEISVVRFRFPRLRASPRASAQA